jgi:ATP-dependent DNA helicase RecG
MQDVVAAPPRGLELFAPRRRAAPLRVSPKQAEGLAKLGIETVQDLLQHFPRRHVDRTKLRTIAELARVARDGEREVTIHARVKTMNQPFVLPRRTSKGKNRTMLKATIEDETGAITVTWFNQDWVARALTKGAEAFFYGGLGYYRGKLQMTSPRFELVRTGKIGRAHV